MSYIIHSLIEPDLLHWGVHCDIYEVIGPIEMQERHVRMLSDDVTDPIVVKALWNALQAVHDAEGVYRHPGQRQMELGMNAC